VNLKFQENGTWNNDPDPAAGPAANGRVPNNTDGLSFLRSESLHLCDAGTYVALASGCA